MTLNEQNATLNNLYDKHVICPVCGHKFCARAVKQSAYRIKEKDSDFFIRYSSTNPYFYDVWLCDNCGYSAMKADFEKIKSSQIEMIKHKITPKWKSRNYPNIYDIKIAIERYKLSLVNYMAIESKSSKKAMNYLKLAWMFRIVEDHINENLCLKQSLDEFNKAYFNEDFPFYGMDRHTTTYLIGELNRRLENDSEALIWFSKVITDPTSSTKIRDKARDQKDLIKQEPIVEQIDNVDIESDGGLLSKLFKNKA